MSITLTAGDARQTLSAHVTAKGLEIREKYGPEIGWDQLQQILLDRTCVRYPCKVVFDESLLLSGEFAHPLPNGSRPEDGFTLYVHPIFLRQRQQVAFLVLYQLVLVNYGEFASPEDAEIFGASALGLPREEYYNRVCQMADQLGAGVACRDPIDPPMTNTAWVRHRENA
jgi:hypothetical protein